VIELAFEEILTAAGAAADVDDETAATLIAARVEKEDCVENGFVLVGYPTTIDQAMLLDERGVLFDVFIHLDLEDDEVKARGAVAEDDPADIEAALESSADAREKLAEYFNAVSHQIDASLSSEDLALAVVSAARTTLEHHEITNCATVEECVEMRSSIRAVFDSIDADKSGSVSIEELSSENAVR
jgi:adenylate kinase family enzyme